MKTIVLFFLAAGTLLSACQQKTGVSDIPGAVNEAFQKQFAGAKDVKWGREEGNFEVNFEQGEKEMSAVFTPSGVLDETEVEIKNNELPPAVVTYISHNYNSAEVEEAARITKANGEVLYEAEADGKDLIFDATGKFLLVKEVEKDKN
jgi:actin-like ATPase involved in cell morphogenesis